MVANPMVAADLRRIADGMADDEVVLADIWNRAAACQHEMPEMTEEQWLRFCRWFSDDAPGLSADLDDYLERFAKSERGGD